MGSWLTYGLGTENQNLPGFVVLCPGKPVVGPQLWSNSFLPGIYQGTHINNKSIDPKTIIRDVRQPLPVAGDAAAAARPAAADEPAAPGSSAAATSSSKRGSRRWRWRSACRARRRRRSTSAARRPRRASCYGDGEFANACLLARRLVERGVRVVQIYYGNGQPWDDHKDINNCTATTPRRATGRSRRCSRDLKARGLLDDTLVIWGGEFGRTPTSEGDKGRDHHSTAASRMWLAGGGVKGGHGLRRDRRARLRTPSRTASTSTTCTPRSCT